MRNALTLSGSIRSDSLNARLARAFGEKLAQAGANLTHVDLADYPLELFNADLEAQNGEPDNAVALARLFGNADIIFIASPEYNGSVSPLLKNTLDWISRQRTHKPFARATFGIGAASPGSMGGISGLRHLREILGSVGALVIPKTLGVGNAGKVLTESGRFCDPALEERADEIAEMMHSIQRRM